MLKSEKRFKYFKSREHILTILRETYPELKLEDIYADIPTDIFFADSSNFDYMQEYGCIIKWRCQLKLISDYTILHPDGETADYPTSWLRKDMADREGLPYVKDLRKNLIKEATKEIDEHYVMKEIYQKVRIENPEELE